MSNKLHCLCPLLTPIRTDLTCYEGLLTVKGEDYKLRITLPKSGKLSHAKIECGWRLNVLLSGYQQLIRQKLEQSSTLISFMKDFESFLEILVESKLPTHWDKVPYSFHEDLINEIDALGWENVDNIDETFASIRLVYRDSKSRNHYLDIQLIQDGTICKPMFTADLPVPFNFPTTIYRAANKCCNLKEVYRYFYEVIELCQAFFNSLDEIDSKTWVLEPEIASRACTFRRFCLGKCLSIQIDINPYHPNTFPNCRLFGADHYITPLKQKLNNLYEWNVHESLLTNLQKILEMTVPSPATTAKDDLVAPCGICYGYRLNSSLPDKVCDNFLCGRQFHTPCLSEWLRSLPSSRTSFSVIHGDCPYCKKLLSVELNFK